MHLSYHPSHKMIVHFYVGRGAVYGYDAVGSFKRDDYGAMGSGQTTVMPILDNLVIVFGNNRVKLYHTVILVFKTLDWA